MKTTDQIVEEFEKKYKGRIGDYEFSSDLRKALEQQRTELKVEILRALKEDV